jgi:hypothetical protein
MVKPPRASVVFPAARILSGPWKKAEGGEDSTPPVANGWMRPEANGGAGLNANEQTSLAALIAYVAIKSGQSEFRVERQLSDRFSIPNPKRLPTDRYEDAIRYLMEQVEPARTQEGA